MNKIVWNNYPKNLLIEKCKYKNWNITFLFLAGSPLTRCKKIKETKTRKLNILN